MNDSAGVSVAVYGIPIKFIVILFSAVGFFFGMLVAVKHPAFATAIVDGALVVIREILQGIVSLLETSK